MMTKSSGKLKSLDQSQQARAMNLRKWREQRLHEEELPSGLHVLLRDVDLASVMLEGNISNTLTDLITSDGFQSLSEEEAGKKLLDDKESFSNLLKQVVTAALAEPTIGQEADDKHIMYSELTFNDKMFIFNYANREAEQMRPFREGDKEPDPSA
jgi:hypothetical protein